MARTRYNRDYTIGAGADALLCRVSLDVLDYSGTYAAQATTVNGTALAGVGVVVAPYEESVSANNVPAERTVANVSLKIYDTKERTIWTTIVGPGMASNKRMHVVLWRDTGTGLKRYFYGVVDRQSVQIKTETATTVGGVKVFDNTITFNVIDILKDVLQEYLLQTTFPPAPPPMTLAPVYWAIPGSNFFFVPNFLLWQKHHRADYLNYFVNWTDPHFTSPNNVMQALANLIFAATDFAIAGSTRGNAGPMDHLGLYARQGNYPYSEPPALTVRYGIGATPPNDTALGAAIAISKHTFIDASGGADSNREYNLTKQSTAYDALKLIATSYGCYPVLEFDETGAHNITLTLAAPNSPTLTALVSGNPEIVPIAGTLQSSPSVFAIDEASCGVMRPSGYNTETQNDTGSDVFTPTISAPSAKSGSGINGESWQCTAWIDDGQFAYVENLLAVFDDPGAPTMVIAADYSMYDNASAYTYQADLFSVTQGWGGGALQGGSAVVVQAVHWQQALTKGFYSLFCGAAANGALIAGAEKIEFDAPLTFAMLDGMETVSPLRRRYIAVLSPSTGTVQNFYVLGVKYNPFDEESGEVKRTIHFVAIRGAW